MLFAGRRIAGEGNAGGRCLAHVAEHHGLNVDGGAPAFGNVVQAAISDGALVHPTREHRADRPPKLLARRLRERLAQFFLDPGLVKCDDLLPFGGSQFGIEFPAKRGLAVLQDFLEHVVVQPHDDVGIHLDEAAVAVIGKALVAGIGRKSLHRLVVEAEIENRVHHARHRGTGTRTDRDEQQLLRIAETAAGKLRYMVERGLDLGVERSRECLPVGIKPVAHLGGDGEPRRHRQAEAAHFGEIGALAAQQIPVASPPFGRSVAEGVNPFGHACSPGFGDEKDWRRRKLPPTLDAI